MSVKQANTVAVKRALATGPRMHDRMGGSNAEAGRERAMQDAAVWLTLAKNCGQNERKADNSHAWAVAKLRWLFAVRMRAAARSTPNEKTGPIRKQTMIRTPRNTMYVWGERAGENVDLNPAQNKWI